MCSVLVLPASATNDDCKSEVQHLLDDDNERLGCETPESIQKFNDYMASLPPEIAEIILSDEELIVSMKLDTYWETNDTEVSSYGSVSLPLSDWPADGKTYFSVDKTTACSCHNSDDNDCEYLSPPSGLSQLRCYSGNLSGHCRKYKATKSIQCKGFADYVFHSYTGTDCGSTNSEPEKLVASGNFTSAVAKTNFYGIPVGSHIRGKLSSGTPHSIIVLGTTSTGITYYQANIGGSCKISTATKTWAQFASWFDSITGVWTA